MTGMSPDIFQVKTGTRPQCFFLIETQRYEEKLRQQNDDG